ncbi:MAG: MFS transporter [Candidatus Atabeyarchaeum deiterrae]
MSTKQYKQPTSWSSILHDPTMGKLVLSQAFFGLSYGIYNVFSMLFLSYLDGYDSVLYIAHYGIWYLVSNLSFGFIIIPAGMLIDRVGRKWVLRIGVALIALSSFMTPLSTVWWHLLIPGAISSLGNALVAPAQSSMVADVSHGYRREKSYSLMMASQLLFSTAGTVSLTLYSYFYKGVLPDNAYFVLFLFVSAMLAFVGAIPIFFVGESLERSQKLSYPPQSDSDSRKPSDDLASKIRTSKNLGRDYLAPPSLRTNGVVLKIILINFLIGLGAGFIIPLFTYYWKDVFKLADWMVLLITVFGDGGLVAGALLAPWMAKRAGRTGGRVGMIVACQSASILCAVFLSAVPWFQYLPLAVVAYVLRQDLMNMISPLTSAMLMDHSPVTRRGAVNAAQTIAFTVPNGVSVILSGIIINSSPSDFGWAYSFFVLITLYIISTWVYYTTRKKDKAVILSQAR